MAGSGIAVSTTEPPWQKVVGVVVLIATFGVVCTVTATGCDVVEQSVLVLVSVPFTE